ncbi:hypothetical protein M9H77_08609 [Catharanthus roseus]|uniref:Uncharacterized protein n=1 Tax=Catharanthus roseus TaxID=4058 RepID=A0ACC0BY95_CATRO|nr:hypothetical protein M9H77_08609 [Catharanthus roseus]
MMGTPKTLGMVMRVKTNHMARASEPPNESLPQTANANHHTNYKSTDGIGSPQILEIISVTPIKQPERPIYYYNLPTLLLQTSNEQEEKAEKGESYLLQQESSSFSFRFERLSETTRKVKLVSLKQIQLSISPRKGKPFPLSTKLHARCQGGQLAQTIDVRVSKGEREHKQTVGSKEERERR